MTEQQQFLLSDCVEAYLPVDDVERTELRVIIETLHLQSSSTMQRNKTSYDIAKERGMEEGKAIGLAQGLREGQVLLLETILKHRLGRRPVESLSRLRALSPEQLMSYVTVIQDAESLADLRL